MNTIHHHPSIAADGWTLVSAEERHAANPQTFEIPPQALREALGPGAAAKLLFDIESKEAGRVIDRGVDRMWVIVNKRGVNGYAGVLDNDPGRAENLNLKEGDTIVFGPEHVAAIQYPPRDYVVAKYGESFFDEVSHGGE
jgi:hypothetical protein